MQELLVAVWLEGAYQIFIQERGSMPRRRHWFHSVRLAAEMMEFRRVYH